MEIFNNFHLVEFVDYDKQENTIYKYVTDVNANAWRVEVELIPVKIKEASNKSYEIYAMESLNTYKGGRLYTLYDKGKTVLIDQTKIIHRFDESNTAVIRDDAIVASFDLETGKLVPEKDQIIVKVQQSPDLEFSDVINGYVGTVESKDIQRRYLQYDHIKAGDKIILQNPWFNGEKNKYMFCKVSINNEYFVIANVKSVVCTI